jgi:hypothetical protein
MLAARTGAGVRAPLPQQAPSYNVLLARNAGVRASANTRKSVLLAGTAGVRAASARPTSYSAKPARTAEVRASAPTTDSAKLSGTAGAAGVRACLCPHKRQRQTCKDCGGSSTCPLTSYNVHRHQCKYRACKPTCWPFIINAASGLKLGLRWCYE